MNRYLISTPANDDLVGIYKHIAADNRTAAVDLIDDFYGKFALLATQPLMGEARLDLADLIPDVRCFPVGNYIVFYQPISDGVCIIRVVHGARDIRSAIS